MRKFGVSVLTYTFPRLQDAIFIGALIAIASQGFFLLNGDGDLGRHLTIGNYILHTWRIPTHDLFSHTMSGKRMIPHEWLAELSFAILHTLLGLNGVVLLIAALIATTFTLTYREMLRRNVSHLLAIGITGFAGFTSSLHWLARPHIFTFLFVALWAYSLENERSKIWIFPLIMLLWANTHGAFIAGFIIWGGHVAGWLWEYLQKTTTLESGKKLAFIGMTSFAVSFINPAGWRLWATSVGYLGNRFLLDQTIEYQSPNFHTWSTWPFLIMISFAILVVGRRINLRPHQAILFAGWTAMSLYSARNIPLFAIVTAPYLGTAIQTIVEKLSILREIDQTISKVENGLRGAVLPLAAVILLAVAFKMQPSTNNQFDPNKFPVKAVDWLQAHPQQGKMFNNFIWGGYLLYRLWPQQTVFIDGQTDFYGEGLTREYTRVMALDESWKEILEKYDVSWVIVPSGKAIIKVLQEESHWIVVYEDETATILHKP